MTQDHEAAIRAAVAELAAALLEAARAEAKHDAPDRLLSVDEAARHLGIGRSTLYGEIGARRLWTLKVGRRRLVPSSALTAYTQEAAPPNVTRGAAVPAAIDASRPNGRSRSHRREPRITASD